jgi:hypothetical protein
MLPAMHFLLLKRSAVYHSRQYQNGNIILNGIIVELFCFLFSLTLPGLEVNAPIAGLHS